MSSHWPAVKFKLTDLFFLILDQSLSLYQSFRVSDVETPIYQSKHYIRLNLATNMNYFAKLVDYFVAKVVLKPLKLCVYSII